MQLKKLLTTALLLLGVGSTTQTVMAAFSPTTGVKYAIRHVATGYYVNFEVNGEVQSASNETGNAVLSLMPSPVYFTSSGGGWTLNTASDNSGSYLRALSWNAGGSASTSTVWTITESGDNYAFSQSADGALAGYLKTGDNPSVGTKLYCNGTATDFAIEIYRGQMTDPANITDGGVYAIYCAYSDGNFPVINNSGTANVSTSQTVTPQLFVFKANGTAGIYTTPCFQLQKAEGDGKYLYNSGTAPGNSFGNTAANYFFANASTSTTTPSYLDGSAETASYSGFFSYNISTTSHFSTFCGQANNGTTFQGWTNKTGLYGSKLNARNAGSNKYNTRWAIYKQPYTCYTLSVKEDDGTITNSTAVITYTNSKDAGITRTAQSDGGFFVINSNVTPTAAMFSTDTYTINSVSVNGNTITVTLFNPNSATKVYTINNTNTNRGAMMYKSGSSYVWSSGKDGATFDATSSNCQWVIYPTGTEGQYYLYNVGANKFAIPSSTASTASWIFSDNAVAVTLTQQSDRTYIIKTATTDTYAAISNGFSGPVINYNDEGAKFTITRASGDQSTAATAAVNKLAEKQTALTAVPSSGSDGWYIIKIKSHGSYGNKFIYPAENEITYSGTKYPLTFCSGLNTRPNINDATFFTRIINENNKVYWQLPNGKYLYGANSKFPISTFTKSTFSIAYNATNGFSIRGNSYYATPYKNGSDYFIGETSTSTTAYYEIYPVNLTTAGLKAWKVDTNGLNEDVKVTCTRSDVSGLASVYNNGYFFLPSSVTPENNQFTVNIGGSDYTMPVTIDAVNQTITSNFPQLTITSLLAEATFTWNGQTQTGKSVTFYQMPGQEVTDNTITVSYSGAEYTNPVLSTTTWDGTSNANVTLTLTPAFFSASYGDKWVRIQSAKNTSLVMYLTGTSAGSSAKLKAYDYTDESQLWCLVGSSSSFTIYNKAAGSSFVLTSAAATPANNTTISLQASGAANSTWKLGTDQLSAADAPGLTLFATGGNGSYAMHGWQSDGTAVKYWGAGSGGSHFLIEDASAEVELAFAGLDPSTMTAYTQNIASVPITLGNTSTVNLTKDNFSDIITTYLPVGAEATFGTPQMFQNYSFLGYGGGQQSKTITTTAGSQRYTATFGNNRKDARYLWEPLRTYSGSGEKDYYRIPAIVTALNGDVIAITDRRFDGASDIGGDHHIDLIGIASSDNGKSWGSEFMIMDGDNGDEKGYGDAAVVADRENNKVLVMACGGNVSYQSSTTSNHQSIDRVELTHNGSTWVASAITNVTTQFYSGDLASCPAMFIGSGSITQSSVIKKGDYYRIYCAVLAKNYGNYVLYSDDFGETWTYLGSASSAASGDEAKVTELPNGSVLLSSRKGSGRYFNVWTWSDGTYTSGSWGTAVATNDQTGGISFGGNSTNGDIRMIPAKKVSDGSEVVLAMQSVPTGSSRSNVSIYYKEVNAETAYTPTTIAQNWSGPFEVTPYQSAYSAFNQQPDGRIAFYMEEAPIAVSEASVGYYMCYVPLTLDEITGGDYQAVSGTLENGKYYRLVSYNNKYLTENVTEHIIVCSDLIDSYSQVWKAEIDGSNIALKNVLTDRYIQKTPGNGWSEQYNTGTSSNNFILAEENGSFTFTDKWSGGLHCDASQNVVIWLTSDRKSKWTVEPVIVNDTELTAQRNAFDTRDLSAFFTTTACTELGSSYATMTDEALLSAMAAMPTTVKNMALKVKNNAWATYSGWDKTEQNFRIADYKAYSSRTRWTSILGLGYSFGCLTNPTGISVSSGDYIQVYVGEIPDGQSVQLRVAGEYQAAGAAYSLKEGMNVLLMASSGNCFVQYEVDNTDDGKAPYTDINSFAPVTVHIEGGTVNGYFDLTKGDDNDDWAKLQEYLLQGSSTVELKTGNLLFHMRSDLVREACPTKMVELLGEWDKILNIEHSLMGWEEYDGYWNNMLSVLDMSDNDYMHASTYGTYYDVETISSVMSYENMFAGGALWGPAHENGHLFQKYINMVGQTEVSNNVFSNVAVFNNGHLTSRASNISVTFTGLSNSVFWNDRDIWERTHLYYQLYQFFHILGKKSDFYPELFKALRSDPMVHTGNTFISAADDYLKFYKKCCQVSGYDLTEFFQAYGFFVIPTLTSYTLGEVTKDAYKLTDYSDYYLTVTQAEIDAAKADVAAMNLPKANIIFIEDRITAPDATYEGAAPGTKKTAINNECPIGMTGETGQYTEFDKLSSAYSYNIKDGVVRMSGTGAVGFKLYDNSGNLVGLYNSNTFILPSSALNNGVLKDGYTIKAADGLGGDVVASYNSTGTTFPMADTWYTFSTPLRDHRYMHSSGAGSGIYGKTMASDTKTEDMMWKFEDRGDGSYDIVNRNDNSYIDPTASNDTQISTTSSQPSSGWTLSAASTTGLWIVCNGTAQLNQTNVGATTGYKVYNWGSGTNTTDDGCQFAIKEAEVDDIPATYDLLVSASPADNLSTGTWYVMFDRGANHGYLYENGSNQLYNTNTHPGLVSSDSEKYLVRLVDAGSGKYYIQTGRANYMQELVNNSLLQEANRVAVTTGNVKEKFTIAKVNSTNGHFYVQGANSVVLDANATSNGDATVVGWGTSVPASTGGNNDWAFYPVSLVQHFAPTATDIYTINNLNSNRGALMSAPSQSKKWVWSSGKNSQTFDAAAANCQWIFVPTAVENQYSLYNVGKQKFMVPTPVIPNEYFNGLSWMFSSDAVPLQLFLQSDGTYKMNTVSGNYYLSVSNNYDGPIINYNDAGAMFTLTKQADASSDVSTQLSTAMANIPAATKPMTLNAVGSKSYATLYLDYDAQTDANTKAYYITEVANGYAQLTEVANEGRNIPAYTAVVLVNENAETNVSFGAGFAVSNGYGSAVAESSNLLKGTLTSMTLDLSDGTPYYSLGRKKYPDENGEYRIGFYKFQSGNMTSITLGANKAYLDTTASGGAVKGFLFDLDDIATDIDGLKDNDECSMFKVQSSKIYNLAGQKLNKPMKGINIINGKKVLVK